MSEGWYWTWSPRDLPERKGYQELGPLGQWLLDQMYRHCDTHGRLPAHPMQCRVACKIFAETPLAPLIQQLADSPGKYISVYPVGSETFIQIADYDIDSPPGFLDKRPAGRYPGPDGRIPLGARASGNPAGRPSSRPSRQGSQQNPVYPQEPAFPPREANPVPQPQPAPQADAKPRGRPKKIQTPTGQTDLPIARNEENTARNGVFTAPVENPGHFSGHPTGNSPHGQNHFTTALEAVENTVEQCVPAEYPLCPSKVRSNTTSDTETLSNTEVLLRARDERPEPNIGGDGGRGSAAGPLHALAPSAPPAPTPEAAGGGTTTATATTPTDEQAAPAPAATTATTTATPTPIPTAAPPQPKPAPATTAMMPFADIPLPDDEFAPEIEPPWLDTSPPAAPVPPVTVVPWPSVEHEKAALDWWAMLDTRCPWHKTFALEFGQLRELAVREHEHFVAAVRDHLADTRVQQAWKAPLRWLQNGCRIERENAENRARRAQERAKSATPPPRVNGHNGNGYAPTLANAPPRMVGPPPAEFGNIEFDVPKHIDRAAFRSKSWAEKGAYAIVVSLDGKSRMRLTAARADLERYCEKHHCAVADVLAYAGTAPGNSAVSEGP